MLPTYNNSQAFRFTGASGTDYAIAFMPFKHQDRHIPQLQLLQKTGGTWETFKVIEDRAPMWGNADDRTDIPTFKLVEGIVAEFNKALASQGRPDEVEKWEEILAYLLENVRFQQGRLVIIE
ncbi:MAG: hypothetical protein V2I66_08060 [Halieaceae bacterium]|jgi:hypothetical protein|nr:hypothetical protein [Halieaceae bacterium]